MRKSTVSENYSLTDKHKLTHTFAEVHVADVVFKAF